MIGTIFIITLSAFSAARLKGHPPAARTAIGFAVGIGAPLVAVASLGRLGIHPNAVLITGLFALIAGLVWAFTRENPSEDNDSGWLTYFGAAFLVSAVTALVGRSPTIGVLVDPWAHMAWSRDLTTAHAFYPPGLPALDAIMGIDHGLVGAFRMAPMILHSALAAQFFAVAECVSSGKNRTQPHPGALAALAAVTYLTVPAAFGKFDPPRPELLAAVFISASWWIVISRRHESVFKTTSLFFLTCAALVSHFSNLEIAHGLAIALTILFGHSGEPVGRRVLYGFALSAGVAVSLAISPWPLTLLFDRDALPYAAVFHSTAAIPSIPAIARMYGVGLSVAGVLCVAWILVHLKSAIRRANGALIGLCVFGALAVGPLFAAALGIDIPISLAVYRFFLAAALPLAILIALATARARESSTWGAILALVSLGALLVDAVSRAVHSPLLLIAAAVVTGVWLYAISTKTSRRLAIAAVFALVCAVSVRLAIWIPSPPPEAVWLATEGDPATPVITNWPLTNALDALVDQPVTDGLAGRDGNVARHRTMTLSPLHDTIDWCGEAKTAAVDSLVSGLADLGALPAYLVVGVRFAESWRLYAEQHARRVAAGDIGDYPFYTATPCDEPHGERIARIREILASAPRTSIEFETDEVAIYRIE
jgi:hypothetical protein